MKIHYRRRLPHVIPPTGIFFVTSRLAGSLPKDAYAKLKIKRQRQIEDLKAQYQNEMITKEVFEQGLIIAQKRFIMQMEKHLHNAHDSHKWLVNPEIAKLVMDSFHYTETHLKAYHLIAYTIMSNHIHLVFKQKDSGTTVDAIMASIKKFTARRANITLDRVGQPFWQDENFDHLVRDHESLLKIIAYVMDNPREAGLCKSWEEWPYSYMAKEYWEYFGYSGQKLN